MLKRTFIHISGVGPKRELGIWRAGIRDWRDFLERGQEVLPPGLYGLGRPVVERSLAALERPGGLAELAEMVPSAEHWRFYPEVSRVVFLDIETGGDLNEWGGVTVVGLYDGERVEQYVAERNIWLMNDAMKAHDVVCTFAGKSFDIPVLKSAFPNMYIPPVHIDLRWVLKRLGFTGGLKRIERRLDLARPDEVQGLDGYDAVRLWAEHQAGNPEALGTLLSYNACDVINLKPLLEMAVTRLKETLLSRVAAKG